MFKKKYDLAIINRSFWPVYPVVGEGLLQLAERVAKTKRVIVLSQGSVKLATLFKKEKRGESVDSATLCLPPRSNISILRRIFESVLFMIWVFLLLCRKRPSKVYVSTDPPIVVPFVVMCYCKIFRAEFVYHLQDIHPEITSIYLGKKGFSIRLARFFDNLTLQHAHKIIVLSEQMKQTVQKFIRASQQIEIVDNPSIDLNVRSENADPKALIFCGNAGRLQRIPLLIEVISAHLRKGGDLKFHFVGAGIFAEDLRALADEFKNVTYHGFLPPKEAAQVIIQCTWGLLPIADEVTKFAFPSKSSTYAASGLSVLAICSRESSVGSWVTENKVGILTEPQLEALLACFEKIDSGIVNHEVKPTTIERVREKLSFDRFVENLIKHISL